MAEESSEKLRRICQSDGKRTRRESLEDLILRAVERVGEAKVRTGGGPSKSRWGALPSLLMGDQQKRMGTRNRNKADRYWYKLSTKDRALVINLEERTVMTD